MRKLQYLSLGIFLLLAFAVAWLYFLLPEIIVTHWNFQGKPDGFMSKEFFSAFFLSLALGIYGLLLVIPKIDPLRKNIKKFIIYYDGMVVLSAGFMLYIYLIVAASNIGLGIDTAKAIIPCVSSLLFYVGFLCTKSKRNWFIGIRTPWTLSSDKVWEKTNRLGGRLLEAYSIVFLLGFFVSQDFFILLLFVLILIFIFTTVYSYFEYRKEEGYA
ncbi:MAG: SdpI family protein [Candidatus Aenigmatarchaeota archaeon]